VAGELVPLGKALVTGVKEITSGGANCRLPGPAADGRRGAGRHRQAGVDDLTPSTPSWCAWACRPWPSPAAGQAARHTVMPYSGNKDGKHYWLTPPELLTRCGVNSSLILIRAPYPRPDGFDGLTSNGANQTTSIRPLLARQHGLRKAIVKITRQDGGFCVPDR